KKKHSTVTITEIEETEEDKWYEEKRGYASVRPDAHLFWWMYNKPDGGRHRPLLLWLQGGPGVSGGYGDIEEIGPLTMDGSARNKTWLRQADLIFIDNPVGAGFSYVTDQSAYTKNLTGIVNDLVSWAKIFFSEHPKFRSRPFYIAGQSYGGKVSAAFAKELHRQMQEGSLQINLKGILLVGAWISPMDFLFSYGTYLNAHSRISKAQSKKLTEAAMLCNSKANSWADKAQCFGESQMMTMDFEKDVNFYNVNEVSTYEEDVTTFAKMKKDENFPDETLFALFNADVYRVNYYARFFLKMNFARKQKHGIIPENITWN
uniref:Serine carboxypeptidase n=1 Tax=Plectus sambesii TaxID=2011161 RepID=A0A914UGU9_9BILA